MPVRQGAHNAFLAMPPEPDALDAGLRRLVRFLTDGELKSLGEDLALVGPIEEESILAATVDLPRYEVVRLFLKAANPTLTLLRQVFDALEALGVHVRTTGCLFVLANPTQPGERKELAFSPQLVGVVATWPVDRNWEPLKTSLEKLSHQWSAFRPAWRRLIQDAEPRMEKGDLDVVESYIHNRTVYEQRYRTDRNAQEVLSYYLGQVSAFRRRLEGGASTTLPREIQSIMWDSDELLDTGASVLGCRRQELETEAQERPAESLLRRYVSTVFVSDFDKFHEDLFLLADLIRGEALVDLLRLDIWSSRPQLYEVWVLLSVLRWLESQGYTIKLRRVTSPEEAKPFEWHLAYSRDSRPCATVLKPSSKTVGHLFFQLYRPSGDMPDISMLEGADASSAPLWSLDPKHSPRGGYGPADYRRTAERYRDSFGAKLSLVAECFPRPWSNPTDFGGGAKLIGDCSPSGSGLPLLLAELEAIHPPIKRRLLCVDFSSSFANQRYHALQKLLGRLSAAGNEHSLFEDYVCFAGNATRVQGTTTWLESERFEEPAGLKTGTAFEPLYSAISEAAQTAKLQEVILVTDGEFDVSLEVVKMRLTNELGLGVEVIM